MYKIWLSKQAANYLESLDESEEERIRKRIKKLKENPKHFGEYRGDFWLLKVGRGGYRVSYRIDEDENVIKIGAIEKRSSSDYERKFY